MLLKDAIETKLKNAMPIASLVIQDQSHTHEKHLQNDSNTPSHLHIIIKSSRFNNLEMLDRHKIIYSVLKDEIAKLHAISIEAIEDI